MGSEKEGYYDCSFVSIHYIICECGETFPSESGLRAHLEKEHPHKRERKEYKCGVCGLTFDSEDNCIVHYEENHIADENQNEDDSQLDEDQDTKPNLEDQEMEETGFENEMIEENQIVEEHDLNNVKDEHFSDNESQSQQMAITTVTSEPQTKILIKRSNRNNVDFQTLHIPEDYGQVTSDRNVQQHLWQRRLPEMEVKQETEQHTLKLPEDYDQIMQVDGQLVLLVSNPAKKKVIKKPKKRNIRDRVCEVCGKKYSSNAALRYHQRVHTGERPYTCHLCPKSFTMPLFLQVHIRTHTGERPYLCPHCPKAFSNKAALLRHDRVHTGEKPYACPMCLKTFTQSNSMKLHVTTVHLKQPAPYKSRARKAKAAERAQRGAGGETKIYEAITIKLDPHENQVTEDEEEEEEAEEQNETNYEVIESEEVVMPDGEDCYEIVYS